MSVSIRDATIEDAEAIGAMAQEFAAYLRALGDPTPFAFDAETFRRDGFGANPAFAGIVAELAGRPAGYLLHHPAYDVDRAMRLLHIVDLWVTPTARRGGIGRALMEAAAAKARAMGAAELIWSVYIPNALAACFYERLGAKTIDDLQFMHLRV
jgi:GNAT superfamily N-acetyltransferase